MHEAHLHLGGLAPAQGHGQVVQAHADGIATEQALVQDLKARALDEADLQQAPLDLGGVHSAGAGVGLGAAHLGDEAAVALAGLGQGNGLTRRVHSDASHANANHSHIMSCE